MVTKILRLKVLGTCSPKASVIINGATVKLTGQKRDRMENLSEHDLASIKKHAAIFAQVAAKTTQAFLRSR